MRSRWSLSIGLLVVGLLVVTFPAYGYILPAKFFLSQLLKKRSVFGDMKIKQTTTRFINGQKTSFDEHIYIRLPGKIRVERWQGGKRTRVALYTQNTASIWSAGGQTKSVPRTPQLRFDVFATSLSGTSFGSLRTLLSKMKIYYEGTSVWSRDSDYRLQDRVHFSWFERGPAVIFGAAHNNRKKNQFWIDKGTLSPVRFIVRKNGKTGPLWDVSFLDYFSSAKGRSFPGRTIVRKNGKLYSRSLTYLVKTNVSIPNRLFSQVP